MKPWALQTLLSGDGLGAAVGPRPWEQPGAFRLAVGQDSLCWVFLCVQHSWMERPAGQRLLSVLLSCAGGALGFGVPGNRRQGGDCLFSAPLAEVAVAGAAVTSAAPLSPQQLAPLVSPIKKRRRSSETRSASPPGSPRGTWSQVKRQRSSGREAETPRAVQSLGGPCPTAAVLAPSASPVPLGSTAEVTKGQVPLALLATQSGCDHQLDSPARALNTTFEICKIGDDARGEARLAALDTVQLCLQERVLHKQDGPVTPK